MLTVSCSAGLTVLHQEVHAIGALFPRRVGANQGTGILDPPGQELRLTCGVPAAEMVDLGDGVSGTNRPGVAAASEAGVAMPVIATARIRRLSLSSLPSRPSQGPTEQN